MLPSTEIRVFSTVAELRAVPGLMVAHYAFILATGRVYRWLPASPLTHDGRTVITSSVGGSAGAWIAVRSPDEGEDLEDGNATITVGDGAWRTLPASTLTASATLTLSTTAATAGDTIEITRHDVGAYTYAIVNGGTGAGTLATMPVSARSHVTAYFDGANWLHRRSGLLLT